MHELATQSDLCCTIASHFAWGGRGLKEVQCILEDVQVHIALSVMMLQSSFQLGRLNDSYVMSVW